MAAVGGLTGSGLASSFQTAYAQEERRAALVGGRNTNNVLVIGYDYIELEAYEDLALADAALSVAFDFQQIQQDLQREGRNFITNVSVLHNSPTPRLLPGQDKLPTFQTIDQFIAGPLEDSNVILYFVGHGVVRQGIEIVHDNGVSQPIWDILGRIGEKSPAARVAFVDCCRKAGGPATADMVSKKGQEVAFIFSAPPDTETTTFSGARFYKTKFTEAFAAHMHDKVDLSTLFIRIRERLRGTNADPMMNTNLSHAVWLAGSPPANGTGKRVPLFFPG